MSVIGYRKVNRRRVSPARKVLVALDNPNGLRWIMEFAPMYAAILEGIEAGLKQQSKHMQVCAIRSPDAFRQLLLGHPPDGVLFLALNDLAAMLPACNAIPGVSVLGAACDGVLDRVTHDGVATGRLPLEFFQASGHRVVAILGPTQEGRDSVFGLRYRVFAAAAADYGLSCLPLLSGALYPPGNPSNQPRPSEIDRLIHLLRTASPRPSALYIMADNLLPAVGRSLIEAGLRPGVDLQVVFCGAGETPIPSAGFAQACVAIPAQEIGLRAVEILERRGRFPGNLLVDTLLNVRLEIA